MEDIKLDPLVSVVPFNVTTSSVEVWAGSLAPGNPAPSHTAIRYRKEGSKGAYQFVPVTAALEDWDHLFPSRGWHRLVRLAGLRPGTAYDIQFGRRRGQRYEYGGQCVVETLPDTLHGGPGRAFTVALGSCFYNDEDDKQVSAAFKKVYGSDAQRPHLKFLAGDQVYADIGLPMGEILPTTLIRDRLIGLYYENWRALSGMLRRGANFIIPDDHEFYNDYPFEPKWYIPGNGALAADADYRKRWVREARKCAEAIERTSPVRTFDIAGDVSFCVADLRTDRTTTRLIKNADLKKIEAWAQGLECPGVLVTSQLVLRGKGNATDHNLADFTAQYRRLVQALAGAGHDVVVLTGDVHFGRVSEVPLGSDGASLIEVVSSPLSNLTGVYAVSQSGPDALPKKFPAVTVPGVAPQTVKHHAFASALGGAGNPKKRTNEHFTTVSFRKGPKGVGMTVIGWRVRPKGAGLPKRDFTWTRTVT